MTNYEYDEMRRRHCEALVQDNFHLHLPVDKLLFDDIETGPNSYAVLFWSGRHLYALFIDSSNTQTLGDVESRMRHMGVKPLKVFPPNADPSYFVKEAKKSFLRAYPSIRTVDNETVQYYKTYANYAPGLVRIAEVGGSVKRYTAGSPKWSAAFDCSFKQILVS